MQASSGSRGSELDVPGVWLAGRAGVVAAVMAAWRRCLVGCEAALARICLGSLQGRCAYREGMAAWQVFCWL